MAAFMTRKMSLLVFFCSFLAAAALVVLLNSLLEGPRLGPHYDFLMKWRKDPPPAPELLIVDSGDLMESGAAAWMIQTLIEMGAETLVIQTPILGFSPVKTRSGEEIRYRFEEEFSLLAQNIRNLFDAIRTGSIAPAEVHRYVDELVNLSDRGKERLTAALVQQDEAGIARLERVAAAFGRVFRAGDPRFSAEGAISGGAGPQDPPALSGAPPETYSQPRPDWDGRVRRIAPVEPGGPEHVVYSALKGRFKESLVGRLGNSLFLVTTTRDGTEIHIPLDLRGNLLVEAPGLSAEEPGSTAVPGEGPGGQDRGFRRIPLELFSRYEETGQALQRLLREAGKQGIYSAMEPEESPVHLFDYAQALWEEFLVSAGPGNPAGERFSAEWKARWLQTLAAYFESLEKFLYGPAEENLKAGYEELLTAEDLDGEGAARISAQRDELTGTFDGLREAYQELWLLRADLSQALAGSFVILGPRQDGDFSAAGGFSQFWRGAGYSDTELSFMVADNILLGRGIRPLGRGLVLALSFLVLALELFVLVRLRPLLSLGLGCALSFAAGAGFSWFFVRWGLWIDPLIPLAGSLAGALVNFSLSFLVARRGGLCFLRAYGPYVGKPYLRQLIRAGQPAPAVRLSAQTAVIAVRRAGLLVQEDQGKDDPLTASRAVESFREEAAAVFKKAGAVIIGCDGDLLLACFGSPLERIGMGPGQDPYVRYSYTPARRAAEFVAELAGQEQAAAWRFGIDAGECVFGYLPVAGYSGYGRPVVRARILSSLCSRYEAKALVSESVRSRINDIPVRKLTVLKGQDGSGGEAFYEMAFPEPRPAKSG
jgi:class 3 adenylate cyclase